MSPVDIFIILFLISALVRGVEQGAVRQIVSTISLLIGLFTGILIQSRLLQLADSANAKALLAFTVIVACVGVCAAVGTYIGARFKKRLQEHHIRAIDTLDRSLGSLLAGATLLIVVWLGAAIFTNAPLPAVQKEIKSSVVIAQLNKTMPAAPSVVTRISHLIDPNTFPTVFTDLEPRIDTTRPLPSIGELDTAVQLARASTVKVQGQGCSNGSSGSGFVVDANLVITNAHVVAGVAKPFIIDSNGRHAAEVMLFNPELDIAVLRTDNLAGKPLILTADITPNSTSGAILGYPGGGDFNAGPALVVESFRAIGQDIYNHGKTTRQVYSVKGTVRPGNSGGPLVDKTGAVIGVIFAESTTYDNVGYALTADSVLAELNTAKNRNTPATTGGCAQ
jgi:S1-C subfamily serine protease